MNFRAQQSRIALFIETGGPGGAERVVLNLAKSFDEAGQNVIVITLREGWLTETLDSLGIRRILVRSPGARDLSLPFRLGQQLPPVLASGVAA